MQTLPEGEHRAGNGLYFLVPRTVRQGRSEAADRPQVWDRDNPYVISIEGKVDLRRLALAVLARR